MTTLSISYRIGLDKPETHLAQIEMRISADAALPSTLTLFLPVWTPGSYLVREYARHVESVTAAAPSRVRKIRKNAWQLDTGAGARSVTVRYAVYCNELTVRTNHLDSTHALLNGAALYLAVEGHEKTQSTVELVLPKEWNVATALTPKLGEPATFESPDLDTLVDCPISAGVFREESFEACGTKHSLVIWPKHAAGDADLQKLIPDVKAIIETEASLFGGKLPYENYVFVLNLSPRGRGGLEHATSTILLANPNAFLSRENYLDLLSLFAHELFHAWNVKRLRPEGLMPYRYQEENYTRLLWWFEGATSYYDWRTLRLARLCSVQEYIDHLADEVAYLDVTHGRLVHPLEEASFDAWIKLYRPDENSQNSSVSYYRKGELVCTLLDLEIRARTEGRATLDRILFHLWSEFGAVGKAVPENGVQQIFERVAEVPLGDLFDRWIRGAEEIDYDATLAKFGLRVERPVKAEGPSASIGIRARSEGGRAIVTQVLRGTAAYTSGIDAGDEIIALGGKRIEGSNLEGALYGCQPASPIEVIFARDGRLLTRQVILDPPRPEKVKIVARDTASEAERQAFAQWLGEPHPAWKR